MFLAGGGNNGTMAARVKSHSNQTNNRTVGISKVSDNSSMITIYPNPSKGTILISNSEKIDELKVTDVLGNTIYETKPASEKVSLQLENSGVYFITIISANITSIKKVIVTN